jgi:hypothetical protein
MSKLLLLLCLLGFFKSEPLLLLKATKQYYSGGIPESGRGCYYNFEMKSGVSSDKISIDSVQINNVGYPTKVYQKKDYSKINEFSKNDSLIIRVNRLTRKTDVERTEEDVKIFYTFKKRTRVMMVTNFEFLPDLQYP